MGDKRNEKQALESDTFKILIASDIHLGYGEKEPGREDDSFNAFEEILQNAVSNDVDFILLGGDLFHDHKPSQVCMYRCLTLIRQYCMGDRPVAVEFISDQSINFKHLNNPVVNYEDPNLNISIPIFSINGNHDDCSAVGVSAMDVLSTTGLVNYFAKWNDFKKVDISPLLLQKGASRLAIYGLSYMNDERLSRLFRDGKEKFNMRQIITLNDIAHVGCFTPSIECHCLLFTALQQALSLAMTIENDKIVYLRSLVQMFRPSIHKDEWFNLMVLHQNRVDHGKYTFIPEEALPNFLDLVIWGHEHECRIREEKNPLKKFHVIQPGSSVATSLCSGEAVEKHIGLLTIYRNSFRMEPIKLETVRPFVMDTITLSRCNIERTVENPSKKVEEYVAAQVEKLIEKSREQLSGNKKQPTVPLIRLRVDYKEEWQIFNKLLFGQQFTNKVANFKDIVLLRPERAGGDKKKANDAGIDMSVVEFILQQEELQTTEGTQVEKVIEKYFESEESKKLKLLTVNGLGNAMKSLMDYSDDEVLGAMVDRQINSLLQYLKTAKATAETADREIKNFHQKQLSQAEEEERRDKEFLEQRAAQFMKDPKNRASLESSAVDDDVDSDVEGSSNADDDFSLSSSVTSGRGRGTTRARARGARGIGLSPASSQQGASRPARGRGSRGPRASSRAANRSYGSLSIKDCF